MSEIDRREKQPKPSKLYDAFVLSVIAIVLFTIFWITPARTLVNQVIVHTKECTISSAKASSSSTGAFRSNYLYVDTEDCGRVTLYENFDKTELAQKISEMKGKKISFEVGLFARGITGMQANRIIAPEELKDS